MDRTILTEDIRKKNIAAVMKVLHLERIVSRAKIASLTGIAPSTASSIITKLEKKKIVEYLDESTTLYSVGRPPLLVRLNPLAFYAVGIDIGVSDASVMIMGLGGKVITRQDIDLKARTDPNRVLAMLADITEEVISESGIDRKRILGLGIGIRGLIDRRKGIVNRSTSLPEWQETGVVEFVQKTLPYPVFLENNANAWILGEARFGAGQGKKNVFGTIIEEGIGSGIIINGQLYTGNYSAAGEFGHMVIIPSGPICSCGNRGCLRTLSSESAIETSVMRIMKSGVQTVLSQNKDMDNPGITAREIVDASRQGDAVCSHVVLEAAKYIGLGLVNVVNTLSPEIIIFNHSSLTLYEPFLEVIRQTVSERAYCREIGIPEIAISNLGENAFCIGAASVVLDRIFAAK